MALCRQMDYPVNGVLANYLPHSRIVCNIGLNKGIIRLISYVGNIFKIPRIGQLVKVDYMIVRIFRHEQTDHV